MRRLALSVLAALVVAACGKPGGPDVVLVTLDTTRADRLGTMGDAEAHTPVLDALAGRGVVFERAYTSVPLTLPSHATILTGRDPDQHGLHDNGRFVLPASETTVAEALAARGWDTAAFVAAFVLDSSFGLDQGFALYDDDIAPAREPLAAHVPRRRGTEVTDRALAWLAERGRAPFFLWVHYYDVHLPRQPPPPFDAIADSYAGALAYVDHEVGRLLAGVERAARGRPTLVVVVGDHGESLGEHDEATHGILAYDSTLHVPLLVAGPGFPAGVRARAFARTVDVAPTILAAAGAPPLDGARGRPLQALAGAGEADDAIGYFESFGPSYRMGWARVGGVRTARWKYTALPAPAELYDTLADPGETRNLVADQPAVAAELAAAWAKLAPPAAAAGGPPLSPDVEEKLAALGYVDLAPSAPRDEAPDPRRFVAAVQLIDAARTRAGEGFVGPAIEALEILADRPVTRTLALSSLAQIYLAAGRPQDAARAAAELLALTGNLDARLTLVRALLETGDAAAALQTLDEGLAGRTPTARARQVRALVLLQLDRPAEALAETAAVLADAPWDDAALGLAARARAAAEGAPAATAALERTLAEAPPSAQLTDCRAVLAQLLREQRRDRDAVRLLEAEADPPPEHRVLLAEIAAAHGNPRRAAEQYEAVLAARPADLVHRRALADLYDTLGRLPDAARQYDLLVAADPRNAGLLVDRGTVRARLGRAAEAEADYRAALALDETLPEAHLNLALVLLQDGRTGEAEGHLRRAIALRPDYQKAHFHLARILAERGDPEAREHADRAAGVGPPVETR
jgi:arylsulfatase A-like enzyme/Tfp pilus assembly protein PilF